MGQQSQLVDAESLQERCRRRDCLDVFFTMSIVFLFVALTAVTVCGVIFAVNLKIPSPNAGENTTGEPKAAPLTYKQTENFVYLETTSSQLKQDSTMELAAVYSGEGMSVGSNFHFDQKQHTLTPQREGNYFMYVSLNITCTSQCSAGVLSVKVGDKLTCEVELPSGVRSVTRRCWTVSWMHVERFATQINVPKGGLPNWKLETKGSGVGMFLVD